MSGILAHSRLGHRARTRDALDRLAFLGGEQEQVRADADVVVAVTRKDWEAADDFSGAALVVERSDLIVGADASLYHRDELRRALEAAGSPPEGTTASHLIAAAYRAWGPRLVEHLSGDYAFVVWDRSRRRLTAARDPLGSRPLFYAQPDEAIAVSSSSRAIAALLDGGANLNLSCLGAQVAGLAWSIGADTAFEGVMPLAPGHVMLFENGRMQMASFWRPPAAPESRPVPAAEAAEELRALLRDAVAERLASGTTSVWMSGGWDSTAVFAAGESVLPQGKRRKLRPVSISYPVGDPGREDEFIAQVAARWDADVHWIQSDDIPLVEGIEERAAASDEPPAHLYELWNRALAKGTRDVGARVALDGSGGDQLFQVSDVVLADLLASGRLAEFARLGRRRSWREMLRAGVLPVLPDPLLDLASLVTGGRIPRHYLERRLTEWTRRDFAARHSLVQRDLSVLRRVSGATPAQRESALYLTLPVWSYGASYMRGALLQEGVEVRSPLLDLRVIEFALHRPVSERAGAAGPKALLRQAMHDLLPADVLAPRAHRTGMTMGFSRRRMREAYPALLARLFSEPLRLAEHGIIEPGVLRAAADRFCAGSGDDFLRVNLFHTMKVEFWLRGLDLHAAAGRNPGAGAKPVLSVTSAA